MKTRAAVLWGLNQDWKVEEIDLDPPKAGEVLVQDGRRRAVPLRRAPRHRRHGPVRGAARAAGLDRFFPLIGGHEGAGVVEASGPT